MQAKIRCLLHGEIDLHLPAPGVFCPLTQYDSVFTDCKIHVALGKEMNMESILAARIDGLMDRGEEPG